MTLSKKHFRISQTPETLKRLMVDRDCTAQDLKNLNEANHRDSFYFSLLRNPCLVPSVELKITKVSHPFFTIG